jgi:hypothetical protein
MISSLNFPTIGAERDRISAILAFAENSFSKQSNVDQTGADRDSRVK